MAMGWLESAKKYSDISSNPERQAIYNRAKQAVQECRHGNIENFSFIQQIVKEDPYDDMGLEIPQKEYELMKADYGVWKHGLKDEVEKEA